VRIYFAGSIRGGRDDAMLYQRIIALLTEYGEVLTPSWCASFPALFSARFPFCGYLRR